MHERPLPESRPLTDVFDRFAQARGLEEDAAWARLAAWTLADEHHARVDAIRVALEDALARLQSVGEHADDDAFANDGMPAGDLLGEPSEWAASCAERWREDGIDAFDGGSVPFLTLRDVVVYGLGFGSAFASVLWVLLLLAVRGWDSGVVWRSLLPAVPSAAGGDDVAGMSMNALASDGGSGTTRALIAPTTPVGAWLIGTLCVAVVAVYGRVLRARSFVMAVVASGAVTAVGACAVGAMFMVGAGLPAVGTGWMLVAAVAFAALALSAGARWRGSARSGSGEASGGMGDDDGVTADDLLLDDEAWIAKTSRLLRARGDMSGAQVRRICEDARAHALESGSTLAGEFGAPGE